jgi:hypothetical protein
MAPPKLKLLYFDIDGLAARIRLACAVGGVEFEDFRFSDREAFMKMKATPGALPFGQVRCSQRCVRSAMRSAEASCAAQKRHAPRAPCAAQKR